MAQPIAPFEMRMSAQNRKLLEHRTAEAENENVCPECGAMVIRDSQHGERVCNACGLVVAESEIDYGPEWRAFDASQRGDRARTGSPLTESLHDRGLSTMITRESRDAAGRKIPNSKRLQLARMRRLHTRTVLGSGASRNLARAISEIHRMASALGYSRPIAEQAIRLYRRAANEDLIRGRSIDGIAAAAIYAVCRVNGIPVDPDNVAEVSHVDRRTLLRLHRLLTHKFELKARIPQAGAHLARYTSTLGLPHDVEARARAILEAAEDAQVTSGRSPTGLAAAAIYVAAKESGMPRTQKDVADATGVTEVTVRTRARELVRFAGNGAN